MISPKTLNIVRFPNSVDPDEAAHTELRRPDLRCLNSSLRLLNDKAP